MFRGQPFKQKRKKHHENVPPKKKIQPHLQKTAMPIKTGKAHRNPRKHRQQEKSRK